MDKLAKEATPYLFVFDFHLHRSLVIPLHELVQNSDILYDVNTITNAPKKNCNKELKYQIIPADKSAYHHSYSKVMNEIKLGNTYLLNLTASSELITDNSLLDFYFNATAKYKLFLNDFFVAFSPETFIKIKNNSIRSFPMKGTRIKENADSASILLSDVKENAEHATIVDLIRNDLSLVADHVEVRRFKYIDEIYSKDKTILQMSSEIVGTLKEQFVRKPGSILQRLLPAGSISGAPKSKTIDIITNSELHDRNFYTGVFGVFDGKNLDSGVLIRYIEQSENRLFFKSGGGITCNSELNKEYQELIDKIYVPLY